MAVETSPTLESPSSGTPSPKHEGLDQASSRLSKRLSLNFPILLPNGIHSGRASPSPRHSTIDPFSSIPPIPTTPTTSSGFLTALASQERRVLELRDELHRAEGDLSKLKKEWAVHEAQKKRNGVQDTELQVGTDVSKMDRDLIEETMSLSLLHREQETKSTPKEGAKTRPRKVFSGSRDTRPLSLLSPNATSIRSSFPQAADSEKENGEAEKDAKPALSRSSTVSQVQPQIPHIHSTPLPDPAPKRRSMPPPSRDALLRTSKQMATDFREGLWTFFEDLRQATVGEEGINGTESRSIPPSHRTSKSKSPKSRPHKPKSPPRAIGEPIDPSLRVVGSVSKATSVLGSGQGRQSAILDASEDFWKEYGMNNKTPSPACPRTSRQALDLGTQSPPKSDDYDNWDIWDSPVPKLRSNSPTPTEGSFSTQRDSPRTNTSMPSTASPKGSGSSLRNFSRPKSNLSPKKDGQSEVDQGSSPLPVSYENASQWALSG